MNSDSGTESQSISFPRAKRFYFFIFPYSKPATFRRLTVISVSGIANLMLLTFACHCQGAAIEYLHVNEAARCRCCREKAVRQNSNFAGAPETAHYLRTP